jgi:biopolymer transport protein ExbB/TolQ/plasmid maintenance system killer protein
MAQRRTRTFLRAVDPSFFLAAILTVAFYGIVQRPSMHDTLLYHYTTEHAVEYVIVALFIWGIVDVILKLASFPRELLALRQDWLPARSTRERADGAKILLEQLATRPGWLQRSRVGKRLAQALGYVNERGSANEFREYLEFLAEQDDEATYSSYTLLRFTAAVTPVLGLVGTVVHFGTALSGISFDEMAERLQVVVSEMGTAFNTTTIALAAAITMMFSLFVCERIERGIVRSIDRLTERELLHRFELSDPNVAPFLHSIRASHEEALRAIGNTLQRVIGAWTQTLEALFQRFDARQQHELRGWEKTLEVLQERHKAYDSSLEERLRRTLEVIDSRQDKHEAQIRAMLERVVTLKDDLANFVAAMHNIAGGAGKLIDIETALSENLRVLHQTQQIDEALHGLTAAIHLLTARQRATNSGHTAAA